MRMTPETYASGEQHKPRGEEVGNSSAIGAKIATLDADIKSLESLPEEGLHAENVATRKKMLDRKRVELSQLRESLTKAILKEDTLAKRFNVAQPKTPGVLTDEDLISSAGFDRGLRQL